MLKPVKLKLHCRKLVTSTQVLLLLFSVSTMLGCSSLKPEARYINVKPKADPIPAEILQAIRPNSTEVLKKAETWYENSGKLLDCVTLSCKQSATN